MVYHHVIPIGINKKRKRRKEKKVEKHGRSFMLLLKIVKKERKRKENVRRWAFALVHGREGAGPRQKSC